MSDLRPVQIGYQVSGFEHAERLTFARSGFPSGTSSDMATIRILATLKSDPTAFLAFYKYAIEHMVLDSLNFLLDVHEYKALPPFLRGNKEEQIVVKYIKSTSKECVNITHRIRDTVRSSNLFIFNFFKILDKWGSARISIFDKAAESCNTLLEDEALADFKAGYKPEQHQVLSLKGNRHRRNDGRT